MATLTINGVEHEAKFNFQFSKKADEKYSEGEMKGKKGSGFQAIYLGLLQASNESLVAFWDCGLAHLKGKEKPSVEDIENAISERVEEDEDSIGLLKEAYQAIDESGFFKQQSKKFWTNFEMLKEMGKTEEEKADNVRTFEMMNKYRADLTA